MTPIHLVLVDDHVVLVDSLVRLLSMQSDMLVLGAAHDADGALELLRDHEPDVLLLDIAMPRGGGMRVLKELGSLGYGTRVLVLSGSEEAHLPQRVMNAGAHGFVTKSMDSEEVLRAIRSVAARRYYFSAPIPTSEDPAQAKALEMLSAREREVLEHVALGHTSKEVAAILGVAPTTVEVYRSRASKKLGLESRADLVRFALEVGLIGAHSYED